MTRKLKILICSAGVTALLGIGAIIGVRSLEEASAHNNKTTNREIYATTEVAKESLKESAKQPQEDIVLQPIKQEIKKVEKSQPTQEKAVDNKEIIPKEDKVVEKKIEEPAKVATEKAQKTVKKEEVKESADKQETERAVKKEAKKSTREDLIASMPNASIMVRGQIAPLAYTDNFDNIQSLINKNGRAWNYAEWGYRKAVGESRSIVVFRHDYSGGNVILGANEIIYKDYDGNVGIYKLFRVDKVIIGDGATPFMQQAIWGEGGDIIGMQTCVGGKVAKVHYFAKE